MASNNSRPWFQNSAIRLNTKHAHHFYCVVVCVWTGKRGAWSEDSHRANQVGWGFETTACGTLSLLGYGPACGIGGRGYGRTQDGEKAKVLRRWAETQRRKRHRLPAALETQSTNLRKDPGMSLNSDAQDQPICQHAPSPRVAHTGKRRHKT